MSGVYAFKHHISVAAHKPEAFEGLGFYAFLRSWLVQCKQAEILSKANSFVKNALAHIVIADFNIPGYRKIFAKRVPLKPIVSESTA